MANATIEEIEQAIVAARSSTYAADSEIIALCRIAGKSDLAHEFVKTRLRLAEVRTPLLDMRAEESDAINIFSHHF